MGLPRASRPDRVLNTFVGEAGLSGAAQLLLGGLRVASRLHVLLALGHETRLGRPDELLLSRLSGARSLGGYNAAGAYHHYERCCEGFRHCLLHWFRHPVKARVMVAISELHEGVDLQEGLNGHGV